MWFNCIEVRALSANEGSGACAWLLAWPVFACFPRDEDILPTAATPASRRHIFLQAVTRTWRRDRSVLESDRAREGMAITALRGA
jgi:hypothetical protein